MNNRIAVFTNGFSSEFIEYIVTGLQKKAKIDGIDIFVFTSYCNLITPELQNVGQANIFMLPDPKDFDGAIMVTNTFNFHGESENTFERFKQAGVPILSLEVEVPEVSCIKTENYNGVRDLAAHLIEHHKVKKIIYVNGVKDNIENTIRRQALLDVLSEHNMELYDEINSDFSFYSAYIKMKEYIKAGKELPDAFVCGNDFMALGLSTALHSYGYSVPENVIITGFDMSKDGQNTFPIMATVSRGWDRFGEIAYDKLMYQMEHPEERFTKVYDSFFVPAESCGCPVSDDSDKNRYNKIKKVYFDNVKKDIIDLTFQRLQIPLSLSTCKEDFYDRGVGKERDIPMFGGNYCICTEPEFFDLSDDDYPEHIKGYSRNMDVLYEFKDFEKQRLKPFDSRELYPGYKHEEGESNLYIFAALNHMNYIMGYIAIKNTPEMLFNASLYKYVINMNALLFSMRSHILSERTNSELRHVYMTDALTGIYNRAGCENVLYEYIKEQKKNNQRSILVFADIDRMKTINDVYGHLNGDLAIKATAGAFVKHSPDGWIFGRYGGDEFIAVGPCPDPEEIDGLLKNLAESMSNEFDSLNIPFMLHASIGYSIIEPEDEGTIEDYISTADKSMYDAKEKIHRLMDSQDYRELKNYFSKSKGRSSLLP